MSGTEEPPAKRSKGPSRRVIVVANRLPVTIDLESNTINRSSGGLVSAMDGVADGDGSFCWVGWPGVGIEGDEEETYRRRLVDEYSYMPVFLSADEVTAYYDGFSNSTLWPLLHYMIPMADFSSSFEVYRTVNEKFADAVQAIAEEGDLIWIHDYHLFLLPAMLKARGLSQKIAFFLHTPFPSYEVWRVHPNCVELVEGVLGADIIGFHTFGYLRHFKSTALRLLGFNTIDMMDIDHDGCRTHLGVYPIGCNVAGLRDVLTSTSECENFLQKYEEEFRGKKLVLSVERLDYSKGVPQKLEAIAHYLETEDDEALRASTVFLTIAVPSRERVDAYKELKDKTHLLVSEINSKFSSFSSVPIVYVYRSVQLEELAALYARADACLVTPLIDGMNLVAKEFLATKSVCPRATPGVLILSQFAGAAEELSSSIVVNPYSTVTVSHAITRALKTAPSTAAKLARQMVDTVITRDAPSWARLILRDLSDFHPDAVGAAETVPLRLPWAMARAFAEHGGEEAKNALFLDYDGTLRSFERVPADAVPTSQMKALFARLDACPHVDVHIISGRDADFLSLHFDAYGFTLVAEHGFRMRRPGGEWTLFHDNIDFSWMEPVTDVMKINRMQTPGSVIEVKSSAIVWHYRQADPEFGGYKATELYENLVSITASLPVEVSHGKRIVEVRSSEISKGVVVKAVLKEAKEAGSPYHHVLVAGDDHTDESMFKACTTLDNATTIKIGRAPSVAQYYLPTPSYLLNFLDAVVAATNAES